MDFVDVIFPLNMGPLTYMVPEALRGGIRPGSMVRAEIKKSIKKGIVLGPYALAPSKRAKGIDSLVEETPVLSSAMLRLIKWMAGYYFSTEGSALKSILPGEFFERVKPRKKRLNALETGTPLPSFRLEETAYRAIEEIKRREETMVYKTFLLRAPSTSYELRFLLETVQEMRNIIIIVPDRSWVNRVSPALRDMAGERRLALYHAGLSSGQRSEALRRMSAGEADVVLGNRGAAFAPLPKVSLIAVMGEESTLFKSESGVRYNARDMAVMRGWQEGATVLLSSVCPSAESYHNALKGKYGLIEPPHAGLRPRVRVIDMRKSRGAISRTLRQAASSALGKGEKVLLYVNRKGFSLLECAECGLIMKCPDCGVPMVFYKSRRALRCGYCARQDAPPEICPECSSHRLQPAGAGIERVEEEIKELNPVGVDAGKKGLLKVVSEPGGRLFVGTKVLTRSAELRGGFSVAGVINADSYFYFPDFRSQERAFQDLLYTAESLGQGGQMIIQTRNPGARVFSLMRGFNAPRFFKEMLKEREALNYPPFSKTALLIVEPGGGTPPRLSEGPRHGAEVLGPVSALTKRGKKVWRIFVKAPGRAELKAVVEGLLVELKTSRVTVDVDPVET